MKFEKLEVGGFESALSGARNPLDSWAKSDSCKIENANEAQKAICLENAVDYYIGEADMNLAKRLIDAGSDSDCKFLRMIYVTVNITAPVYWWREMDTYKVATVTNSRSLQHRGMVSDYSMEDFTIDRPSDDDEEVQRVFDEMWNEWLDFINTYRLAYKNTKDYTFFRCMRQMMPMGYNYMETWSANYAVLRNIYRQRKNHKLKEWHDFCDWIETLPYSELITHGLKND